MSEGVILNKINTLLHNTGYSEHIKDITGLKNFLRDENNKSLEVYDQIEELYDVLMIGQGMW